MHSMHTQLKLGGKLISRDGERVYIVAEIGQNHQGSMEIAKRMITAAKSAGCDCVKFQKSNLQAKFTALALSRSYTGPNSFGGTYGEHKTFLEFNLDQYRELQSFSKQLDIDFTASAMDEISLAQLSSLKVPFIKIGSGDTNNYIMLQKAARMHEPLIISTGMQPMSTVDRIVQIMHDEQKQNFVLLHCVSAYPTDASDATLQLITAMRQRFPTCIIGYSGHELGIEISTAAVLLGAKVIERHFTLDKTQKGSDHKCSLEPYELRQLVERIRRLEGDGVLVKPFTCDQILAHLGRSDALLQALRHVNAKEVLPSELSCKRKLGKSLVAARNLRQGTKLQPVDVCIKVSEPNGIEAEHYFDFINAEVQCDILADEPITRENVKIENAQK